jgi:hypothetical protein
VARGGQRAMSPLGVAAPMPSLPSWAQQALDAHLPPGNPLLNGREVSGRLVLANTRLGAVLLQRPLVGDVRVTFVEIPASKVAFQCGGCGENLQFLNLDPPRRVFCSICALPYQVDAAGQVAPAAAGWSEAEASVAGAEQAQAPLPPVPADDVGLVTMEEPAPAPEEAAPDLEPVYDGPGQALRGLEGMAAHAEALEAQGVGDTAALRRASAPDLSRALGVPVATVAQWQAAAELLLVRGIGPQAAETLARAGVRGIDDLRRRSGAAIARQVAATQQGRPLSAARIEAWRSAARTLRKAAPVAAQA